MTAAGELEMPTHNQAIAKFFVRGAMDPRFNDPEARDEFVLDVLRFDSVAFMTDRPPTPESARVRAELVVSFLRGWVEHHLACGAERGWCECSRPMGHHGLHQCPHCVRGGQQGTWGSEASTPEKALVAA